MSEIEKIVNRVKYLRENDLITDAEELVIVSLEEHENSWQLWLELGHIRMRKQDYEYAAEAFQNATNLGPEAFWPWLNLGHAQRALGDYEAAIDATQNALRVEGDEKELHLAYYNLARYNALKGRIEEAMELLKTALENDESLRKLAREDSDLDSLRKEPGFEFLVRS